MNPPRAPQNSRPPEPIEDEKGDHILARGQYNKLGPIIGMPLAVIGIASSLYFLISRRDSISQTLPLVDGVILATSGYAFYYCVREFLLGRRRSLTLTTTRLYGHDGRKPFDFPLNDIRSVSEETTRSQFTGTQTFIVVQATRERSVRLEQLKDIKGLQQSIRAAREKARDLARTQNQLPGNP